MDGEKGGAPQKKAKLFITLTRHADFHKNMEEFEKIRAENDKLAGKTDTKTPQ